MMIKRPQDWRGKTKDNWGIATSISLLPVGLAAFICMLVSVTTHGPRTDAQTQAFLRKAWVQVEERTGKHDNTFGSITDIEHAIDYDHNTNGPTSDVIYGIGPAGVHDAGSHTILVDAHTTPRRVILFAHSDSGRDWKLDDRLGQDPIVSTTADLSLPTHYKHVDKWAPSRNDGLVTAGIYGAEAAFFLFCWIGGTIELLIRNGFRRSHRGNSNRVGLLRRMRSRRQLRRNRELAATRWRSLIGNGMYGPKAIEAGYEVFLADKEQSATRDGEIVRFVVRRMRWNASACDWLPANSTQPLPAAPQGLKTAIPAATDLGTATDAWFDFCNWVDTLNRQRWEARAQKEGIELPSPEGRLVDMLPSAAAALGTASGRR